MPLSDKAIQALKPTGKTRKVADEKGLYLEVSPKGGLWWRWKYRYAGKEKRLSFGVYDTVSLKDARVRREEARKLLAQGVDPGEQRKQDKRALNAAHVRTFEVVALEWYEKQSAKWSESHRTRILSMFKRCLFPALGNRPISAITAPELLPVIQRIEMAALDTAHRALSDCGRIFNYAIASSRATSDPTVALKGALAPRRTNHFAATTDPKKLGQMLRMMDRHKGSPVVRAALRLQPLLFVRPGELRKARWADVDLKSAEWRYKITKTRGTGVEDHVVPLSRQAVEILEELHKLTGTGDLVFPGARSAKRPMSDNAVLVALRTLEISADDLTGHGFRAIARTILDEILKFRPDIIEHQLGHRVRDPLGRAYNRTQFLEERKTMMQAWADHLDKLKSQGGEVIAFLRSA